MLLNLTIPQVSYSGSLGIAQTSYTAISTTSNRGALKVIIRDSQTDTILGSLDALWIRNGTTTYFSSGARHNNLIPGEYVVTIKEPVGSKYLVIQPYTVKVNAKSLSEVTLYLTRIQ